ncbi:MAG: ribosome assembly RNA-binding protein YhbY [Ruminococcus sp.]|nr:ribosome assembly RNA-binding protein YhbY [Ruminococcus sp.]MBQ7027001.1 ribosome assembly RNA-binding protein YhbY [Ruminococcus sp.]MDD6060969.1 ribosome assembly RNA-binding protein YhbY [Ruminococcus sp.]
MLTSKQRAYLRGIASTYETIFQVGKGGVSEAMCKDIGEALRKRELIKLRVLENSGWTAREAAEAIAEQTGSEVVQVIGSKFVLFKRNPKEPVIENIPKAK